MDRSPEEQEIFDAVYADRIENLKLYPKTRKTIEAWLRQLHKNNPPIDLRNAIAREATVQAYEDEIKRLQLLSLIEN